MVGQLGPPLVCIIPSTEIVSMHRVVGALGQSPTVNEHDKAALALIAPFRKGRHISPIGEMLLAA
jgi:hypothetical protein